MWAFSSKFHIFIQRFLASLAIVAVIATMTPPSVVFAEETGGEGTGSETASSTEESTTEETPVEETATSSEETTTEESTSEEETASSTEEATASSTEETTGGGDGTDTGSGGDGSEEGDTGGDGAGSTESGDTATTTEETATSTASSTPETGTDGDTGSDGDGGGEGSGGATGEDGDSEQVEEPIPLVSSNDIGEDATPDDGEGVTGGLTQTGRNTAVITGPATAQGEVANDANTSNVKSFLELPFTDLDVYTFQATGTNDATVTTDGAILAMTGENAALATGASEIETGNSIAALNIANVINSNIVNSDGLIALSNRVIEENSSLDLRDFFFPDPNETRSVKNDCDLLSCAAEDVVYTFTQENTATVTNDAILESVTGDNRAEGDYAQIKTGDAYAGANVINVVNTNIVDSNYRLLTMNAVGDLDGDLMLPTEELFHAFYSKPNAISTLEEIEDATITIGNHNEADVNNNVETTAETGNNLSTTAFDASIITGDGESESNILNEVNENIFGGDSLYILIRVHGYWSGDVHGLPAGMSWQWTPDGILIYNTGAEIAPSALLPYDRDSYTGDFDNQNDVVINNNITVDAITGENEVDGLLGAIETGDAYASANVMNIANTNVIGTNWTMAVVNIFGDFDGNVTFSATDLAVTGSATAADDPLGPGSLITYTYDIENVGSLTATNATIRQTLESAYMTGNSTSETFELGTLAPGQTKQITIEAHVDDILPEGSTDVIAVAEVDSNESDNNEDDNVSLVTLVAEYSSTTEEETDGGDEGAGGATGGGTGTTTDDGSGTGDSGTEGAGDNSGGAAAGGSGGSSGGSSGGGGGGGGGGSSSKTKSIDRVQKDIDPESAPFIVLKKEAKDIDKGDVVRAGEEVEYTITVTNTGGEAYDVTIYDTLTNPIGAVISEQSWPLGTVLAGEQITLEYTTLYKFNTPSGTYTNTASVKAYRDEDTFENGGKELKLDDAVHKIEISGVELAIGNVGVLAYYPGANGKTSALISWETNKPATGQVFYSPEVLGSTYNTDLPQRGYQHESFKFEKNRKTKHVMILRDLTPGVPYVYKIEGTNEKSEAVGGNYTLPVPASVRTLTLSLPNGTPIDMSRVAGIATSAPTPAYTPPTPSYVAPTPAVEPEASEPEPVESTESEEKKGIGGFVGKVFNFFR